MDVHVLNFADRLSRVGWRHATTMAPYAAEWKIQRKSITKVASTNVSVSVFDRVQGTEAAHFLLNLLTSPDKLFDHIRKEAGSVILKITYGYTTVANDNDPLVDLASKTMEQFADATVPGKWSVDIFPFRKYDLSSNETVPDLYKYNTCPNGYQEWGSKAQRERWQRNSASVRTSRMNS